MTSSFLLHETINENSLTDSYNVDWLRDLRIKFTQEKFFDDLEYLDLNSIDDEKKARMSP